MIRGLARRFAAVSAVALLTTLAGCTAGGAPAQRSAAGTTCAGQQYVEVRNDLASPVDVYGYVGTTAMYLGTVSTGVHRVPLLQPVGYVYAQRDGRRVSARHRPSPVAFRRVCTDR